MTSMLLTERSAPASVISASRNEAGALAPHFLRAVARGDALLLRIGERRLVVHFGQHCAIRLDPVGDEFPMLAVPLLDANFAVALVVGAGARNRHHQPVGAQRGDALRGVVKGIVAT